MGRRVARLRIAHGESLRQAALRTGVSHSTIARIEKGEVTGSYQETLRKVADGYGITLAYLLTGQDSFRPGLAASLRPLTPREQASLIFLPGRERARQALAMVTSTAEDGLSLEQFAAALGLDADSVVRAINGQMELPPELLERLQEQFGLLTGLSPRWFRWSLTEPASVEEEGAAAEAERYLRLAEKCCRARLQPSLVEMAVDLLRIGSAERQARP